ncbi:MAG: hypothetical protein BMS9Abin07_1080 [Acidimicrobiia bacterium]|nr:MAG: hypothetical protein BMS9Abin07_1080 [Acidimicrobiia bacterium]
MVKRALATALAAVIGSAVGYAVHQAIGPSDVAADEQPATPEIMLAAPLTNAAVAFVAGALTGRRAPLSAFVVGVVISALFGTDLDRMLPIGGQSPSANSTNSLHNSA